MTKQPPPMPLGKKKPHVAIAVSAPRKIPVTSAATSLVTHTAHRAQVTSTPITPATSLHSIPVTSAASQQSNPVTSATSPKSFSIYPVTSATSLHSIPVTSATSQQSIPVPSATSQESSSTVISSITDEINKRLELFQLHIEILKEQHAFLHCTLCNKSG